MDRIKASREGLWQKFFQPRFLSKYGESSFSNLAPKILNKVIIYHSSYFSTTSNQQPANLSISGKFNFLLEQSILFFEKFKDYF